MKSNIAAMLLTFGAAFAATAQTNPNANIFLNTPLVSNVQLGNAVVDPNLIDPWGISFSAASPFWVSNHLSGTSTLYNGSGVIQPTVVKIPLAGGAPGVGRPTGQVNNSNAGKFLITGGQASFIFATEDGTISAWRGGAVSEVKVDNSASQAVYKGLASGTSSKGPVLYAANFRSGRIDVFDSTWAPITLAGSFTDPAVPAGFAPFNIWNIAGTLYVTYAKQDAAKYLDVAGPGNGYLATFDLDGNLKVHLLSGGDLNSPWGIAVAPSNWGRLSGAVLVGNFGDGRINAYNTKGLGALGPMLDASGNPITIPGLWALVFGNGGRGGDVNTLYYAAGQPNGSAIARGILGSLAPPAAITSVTNAASQAGGAVAPGEIVLINGQSVGATPLVAGTVYPTSKPLTNTLSGTSVTVNGIAAPIVFTNGSQTSVQVPYGIAGTATASFVVKTSAQTTSAFSVPVANTAPGIFTLDFSGKGPAVALNADGSVNSAGNPAAAGSKLMIFTTGEGVTTPSGVDGAVQADMMRMVAAPVVVTFNGVSGTFGFAAGTPNDVAGVADIGVTIPQGIPAGPVTLAVSIGGIPAQSGVTVFVQ